MLYQINEAGIFIELYSTDEIPFIEIDGELIQDPSFVKEPMPNDRYMKMGVSPKWTGTEWVATAEPPEPTSNPPSEIEKLEAKITAATEYTDFLEEVIVEMAQVVFQ